MPFLPNEIMLQKIMKLQPVIGLEIHVQLKTRTKMFCSCANRGEADPPNTNICPTCTGQPGTLPNINKQAVEFGMLIANALGAKTAHKSKFDRKNYFYPDLPKGYQISQFDLPVADGGKINIIANEGKDNEYTFQVGITRAHLEEDAAKLHHYGTGENKISLVDYNRAGTPLIEIVTEPDIKSPADAKFFLQELRLMMRYLGVSDADMEKGNLRCDANISLRQIPENPANEEWLGIFHPKTEIKNINSFKAVERALDYEIKRQTKLWLDGKIPQKQTTRGWDDARGVTVDQRTKEDSSDYRYFPEPDLPTMDLSIMKENTQLRVPELPAQRRIRFADEYGLSRSDAKIICNNKDLANYVEQVFSELAEWSRSQALAEKQEPITKEKSAKLVSGWLLSKLNGIMSENKMDIKTIKMTPENFAELLTMIHFNKVTGPNALIILTEMAKTGADPSIIMEEKKLGQMADVDELLNIVIDVIKANPKAVEDWKKGKETSVQFLVGQVMKATRGNAPPNEAKTLLEQELQKL